MSIQAGIQSLLAIKTIADGLIAVRDETKVLEVKLALMQQVFEIRQVLDTLQEEASAIKEENRNLKEQIRQAEQRDAQLAGYEQFQPVRGVFVYAAQPLEGGRPQPPYLCKTCYDGGKKATLNYQRAAGRLEPATLQCPEHARHAIELPQAVNWDMLVQGIAGG